jgi:hypothetical protein
LLSFFFCTACEEKAGVHIVDRKISKSTWSKFGNWIQNCQIVTMTDRELIKLEASIRLKMEDIRKRRVTLKDSGIGMLMNNLKKADEALYDKILPDYKKMVAELNALK